MVKKTYLFSSIILATMEHQTEVAAPSEVDALRAKCAGLEARLAELAEQTAELRRQQEERDTRKDNVRTMMEMLDKFVGQFTACGSHLGHRFSYELFGSLVGWVMTGGIHKSWQPHDVDLRVWTLEGLDTQTRLCRDVDHLLHLMVLMTKGADVELTSVERARAYNPEVRALNLRKLKVAFRLNGEVRNLDIDMVLAPELPAPECTMTAWSLVRAAAGWTLKYRGTDHTNASGFLGTLLDAQEKKDVQWLTPISGHYPFARYQLSRFAKLCDKGLPVSNPPFRVANAPLSCAVCMDTKSNALVHSCGHTTCVDCASKIPQPRCPECRAPIFPYLRADAELPARTQRLIEEATAQREEGSAVSA